MRRWLLGLLLAVVSFPALAQDLPKPAGEIILSVVGAMDRGNGDNRADFDRSMLEALGMVELTTRTAWTKGDTVFRGVPLKVLLDKLGVRGQSLRAVALNAYSVLIPLADLKDWPILLAMDQDGAPLPRRGKGPVWIVYPGIEGHNDAPIYRDRSIWQLRTLEVR